MQEPSLLTQFSHNVNEQPHYQDATEILDTTELVITSPVQKKDSEDSSSLKERIRRCEL